MPLYDPHFWRAAGHLEHFLKSRADDPRPLVLSQRNFFHLQSLMERLQTVEHHCWDSSAQAVARQLHAQLKCCESQIATALTTIGMRFTHWDAPHQADLYEELITFRNEFEDCAVDLRSRTVRCIEPEIDVTFNLLASDWAVLAAAIP